MTQDKVIDKPWFMSRKMTDYPGYIFSQSRSQAICQMLGSHKDNNAKLIIKAVNNYEALKDAVLDAEEFIDSIENYNDDAVKLHNTLKQVLAQIKDKK